MAEEAAPKEGAEEAAPPKKKFGLVQILIGVQIVVILGAAGVIVKVALKPKKFVVQESAMKERAIASVRDDLAKVQTIELESFVVNLPEKHTLKTQIQIEVSDPSVAEHLQKKKAAVRARILNVLTMQTFREAEKIQGKLLMKDAIRDAINEEIFVNKETQGVVRDVYFSEFMLM